MVNNKSIKNEIRKADKMKNQEIRNTVAELQNLYSDMEALKAEITSREAMIKEEMEAREVETLDLGNVIVRFTSVLSSRFDTKAFKKDFADIYALFTKQVASRRFSIA